jgi:hypothetical protein
MAAVGEVCSGRDLGLSGVKRHLVGSQRSDAASTHDVFSPEPTMASSNVYEITLQQVAPRDIAAVRARVPASRVAAMFRTYLDQVYAAGRTNGLPLDGQNIFVYRSVAGIPDQLDVEFGVGVGAPFTPVGSVALSATPGGKVATTTHWGDYSALGDAHAALIAWCRTWDVSLGGTRWEVYGHWREGTIPRTDVYHLVHSGAR